VILGLNHPKNFVSSLTDTLSIEREKAIEIAQEVNHKIFFPIREELKKLHGISTTEELTPTKQESEEIYKKESAISAQQPPKPMGTIIKPAQEPAAPKPAESAKEMPKEEKTGLPATPASQAPKTTAPKTEITRQPEPVTKIWETPKPPAPVKPLEATKGMTEAAPTAPAPAPATPPLIKPETPASQFQKRYQELEQKRTIDLSTISKEPNKEESKSPPSWIKQAPPAVPLKETPAAKPAPEKYIQDPYKEPIE
jgi:hypothetical protein